MSKRHEDTEGTWGKLWDRACKEAEDGIEESSKKFQRGMSKENLED